MSAQQENRWAARVEHLATDFSYPDTPDLSQAVAQQLTTQQQPRWQLSLRPVWAILLILALLFAGAMGLPSVRAAVLEWLQIGAVRIWLVEPPIPTPTEGQSAPILSATPTQLPPPTPSPTPLLSILDFVGETTLAAAQAQVDFPIHLSTLPVNWGEPDHVFLQQWEGDSVILVWMQPGQPDEVRLSLHLLGPGAFLWKMQPEDVTEVTVNGQLAYWAKGPYYIQVEPSTASGWSFRRLVDGHVLIWFDGEMTYRLESDLALDEAIQIAESFGAVNEILRD